MTTHKTATQWQQLFEQRETFDDTNIEFCQHHNVAITTYYKKRELLQAQNHLPSKFVQVKQTTEITVQADHATIGLVPFDYIMVCLNELCQPEPDIDSLLAWNFKKQV